MIIKCKLCDRENIEAKPNTHYLTYSIIKTALNEDGSTSRNKGLIFEIDSTKSYVDFKYQQSSPEKIEQYLGRKPTDEENKAAETQRDCAVDDSFCKDCEDKFGLIESAFSERLTKKFRMTDLTNVEVITLNEKDAKLFRLFFLLQVWRVSVCTDAFKLPENFDAFFKEKIMHFNMDDLELIPMSVTYLQTLRLESDERIGADYKTGNVVNGLDGRNPYVIFMNDFVIQMYDQSEIPFFDFHQLNEREDYLEFLNHKQSTFKIKVFSDIKRRKLISDLSYNDLAKPVLINLKTDFFKRFVNEFGKTPSFQEVNEYSVLVTKGDHFLLKERLDKFTDIYFKKLSLVHRKIVR